MEGIGKIEIGSMYQFLSLLENCRVCKVQVADASNGRLKP